VPDRQRGPPIDVAEELAVVYDLLARDDAGEVDEQLGVTPQDGGDGGAAGAGEVEVGVGVCGVAVRPAQRRRIR